MKTKIVYSALVLAGLSAAAQAQTTTTTTLLPSSVPVSSTNTESTGDNAGTSDQSENGSPVREMTDGEAHEASNKLKFENSFHVGIAVNQGKEMVPIAGLMQSKVEAGNFYLKFRFDLRPFLAYSKARQGLADQSAEQIRYALTNAVEPQVEKLIRAQVGLTTGQLPPPLVAAINATTQKKVNELFPGTQKNYLDQHMGKTKFSAQAWDAAFQSGFVGYIVKTNGFLGTKDFRIEAGKLWAMTENENRDFTVDPVQTNDILNGPALGARIIADYGTGKAYFQVSSAASPSRIQDPTGIDVVAYVTSIARIVSVPFGMDAKHLEFGIEKDFSKNFKVIAAAGKRPLMTASGLKNDSGFVLSDMQLKFGKYNAETKLGVEGIGTGELVKDIGGNLTRTIKDNRFSVGIEGHKRTGGTFYEDFGRFGAGGNMRLKHFEKMNWDLGIGGRWTLSNMEGHPLKQGFLIGIGMQQRAKTSP